jgi:O-antigen/teichoic acid export membrane protein
MSQRTESGGGLLARNTALNIAGQVIPLLVAVATIPYVVRGLGPERFGILSVAWLVLGYFALLDFGLGRATTKFIAACLARAEFEKLPGLFWGSLGLQILMGCCGGLLLAILSRVLVERAFHVAPALQYEARWIFRMLAFSLPFVLATNGLRAALEAAQRFDLVNSLRIPASISVYVLPALGLALGASLAQIVLLMVLARLIVCGAHLVCCFVVLPGVGLHPRWSRTALTLLLRYGGWVTVSNLANPVLLYIDRFFIGSLLSLTLLGFYTVPFEAVTKLWIVPASLASTLFPAFSALTATNDRSRITLLYARSFKYLLLLLGPVVLMLVLFARDILTLWMGAAFAHQTTAVFQILACGVFVNCFAHIPFGLLQSHGRPDLAAKVLLCELPLYLPLAWFLVRHGGISGAAAGWTLRVTVEAAVFVIVVAKVFALDPHALAEHGVLKSLLGITALGMALVAAKLIFRGSVPGQLAASMGLTGAFCGLVWRKLLDPADRGQVRGVFAPVMQAARGWVTS